jgi:hypothetical protein
MIAGPMIGVSYLPQVSTAQWTNPDTRSAKKSPRMSPMIVGSGP